MSDKNSLRHRIGQAVFAGAVGIASVILAFNWITNEDRRVQREAEERAVLAARALLVDAVGVEMLEIVDPLSPDRVVGKGYIYEQPPGWAVSGYYRRSKDDRWHPYLLVLTEDHSLHDLKTEDPALR